MKYIYLKSPKSMNIKNNSCLFALQYLGFHGTRDGLEAL